MLKRFHNGLASIAECYNVDIKPIIKGWTRIYALRRKTRGKQDAVKFCKELNTVAERYALRQKIEPIPWTKSSKDGFPLILNFAKQKLRSEDQMTVVLTLSVFRSSEVFKLPISKDIESVTKPCGYDTELVDSIIAFIPEWVNRIPPIKLPDIKYHFTLKNGPNGHALKTSDMDISAVIVDDEIHKAICEVQRLLKDDRPMEKPLTLHEGSIHSRLTQFPEKSGKTRTIAIIDYYSQRCLKPLHEGLMNILSKLVSDGTYSHQSVGNFAKQATKDKSFIACSDLTAATDRFPAIIQESLLKELLKGTDLAEPMWTLLAKRTFKLSWSDQIVTYGCGQPMGAYGSWPLFALAHHLIVEYCANTVIKSVKHNYRIIGDDNAITIKAVYDKYLVVMQGLGLEINKGKTVISPEGAEWSAAEVAKQLYLNGINITPLSPGFVRNIKKPYMFNTCLGILLDRYGSLGSEVPSILINKLYRKGKTRKLVWLLGTNPINGHIKPTYVGYDEYSPWDLDKSSDYLYNYQQIIIEKLSDQAMEAVDRSFDMLLSPGSQWKDSTSPEPLCYKHVIFSIQRELTRTLDRIGDVSIGELDKVAAELDYIPDPYLPYQSRQELRHKRVASVIESLLDYKESRTFIQLDW
uniref:RNA-dependent RNA polymerase n=1 Tax=Etepeofons virus TaxID=3072205 RepID=A0AA96SLN9_9VIRU|nr:MAG: RNA-dependent RNA polymerase [Etepeofons virus]